MGGRRIPEAVLERDYCLSWALVGVFESPLKDCVVFKGGTALKKCYFADYRFSEDLDFTLVVETALDQIERGLETASEEVRRRSGVGIRLDHIDRHSHVNSHTLYLAYNGPLPGAAGKIVKVDFTIRERIVYSIEERPLLGYKEYSDVPKDVRMRVYSLNEVALEKVVALLDRARNEPRDLYDLWFLTANQHIDLETLRGAVVSKLDFRHLTLEQAGGEFLPKKERLRRLWQTRLSAQMADLPEFDGVYRAVSRSLRQAGITTK